MMRRVLVCVAAALAGAECFSPAPLLALRPRHAPAVRSRRVPRKPGRSGSQRALRRPCSERYGPACTCSAAAPQPAGRHTAGSTRVRSPPNRIVTRAPCRSGAPRACAEA